MVLFVLVRRALAVSGSVAIAFGLHLPNASWLPVATIIASKASVEPSLLAAEQRVAGAILGAAVAWLLLLTIDGRLALEMVLVVLSAVANSIRNVNYALYTAAAAATVLIATDLPHPSSLAADEQRILYTFVAVGIGVAATLLTTLSQKHASARAAPPAPSAG